LFVIYQPEDGDRQEWTFNPGRVRATEGQVLLREFGQISWDMFIQGIRQNDLHARRVLLWHLIRRQHPMVKFADTPDFYADEMTVEFSTVELAEMLDKVASTKVSAAEKEQLTALFEAELEIARQREEANDLAGKAPTPTSTTASPTTG
jgi:hypothetical protein